ncbi:MAG: HAD hydrolase-like protein [Clostridia bacterium]|nr:HAD hydrolase-like protein [Clostridia bacterium]
MNIGIDIDDTLSTLFKLKIKFVKKYCKQKNWKYKFKSSESSFFSQMFEWPSEEDFKMFWNEKMDTMLSIAPLRKGVVNVLNKLKKQGHKLIIITARSEADHKKPYEMSYDWLTKNKIPFDKLFVGHLNKSHICLDEKIDIFIDDYPKNIIEVGEIGVETILIEAPHNKNFDGETQRAKNWKQIYKLIQERNK